MSIKFKRDTHPAPWLSRVLYLHSLEHATRRVRLHRSRNTRRDEGALHQCDGAYGWPEVNTSVLALTCSRCVFAGQVTGISWDDGCHFCSSDQCQQNTYEYSGELITGEGAGESCYWPDSECLQVSKETRVLSE